MISKVEHLVLWSALVLAILSFAHQFFMFIMLVGFIGLIIALIRIEPISTCMVCGSGEIKTETFYEEEKEGELPFGIKSKEYHEMRCNKCGFLLHTDRGDM